MIEAEKKGSPWPWILVPVAAVTLFFVLRECRQSLPPADLDACRARSGAGRHASAAVIVNYS